MWIVDAVITGGYQEIRLLLVVIRSLVAVESKPNYNCNHCITYMTIDKTTLETIEHYS